MTRKARYFWPILFVLVMTDCSTKDWAVEHLDSSSLPHAIVDPFLRLTLVHNPGIAFGFDVRPYVGSWARPLLIAVMIAELALLLRFYAHTPPRARAIAAALALTCGGAVGNLLDRFRFPLGVVDFIDVGIGAHRFWIFNIADAGINVGAITLAFLLWRNGISRSPRERVV